MAFGDTVQSAQGTGTSGEASATLGAGATAGNLIIFAIARSAVTAITGDWGAISGFTAFPQSPGATGNMGSAAWWKIAAGGETTITTASTDETGNWCAAVVELEGPFAVSPLDKSAEDESHISSTATSQSSGTTATTVQNDELAAAYFGADNGSNVSTTRAYTNSFSEVIFANSGARASVIVAKKVLSATGAIESTFSTAGTGDEMYGAIATFKKAGGTAYNQAAGGTVTPAGTLANRTGKPLAGTVTPAGALVNSARKVLAGALTTAGALVNSARKVLAGALTSSGALVAIKTTLLALGGTLTTAGAVVFRTAKTLSGSVAPSGALVNSARKVLAGALTSAGTLANKTGKVLAGALTSAGVLVARANKALGGSLAPTGTLALSTRKALTGTLTTAGTVAKRTARVLAGALAIAGDVVGAIVTESAIVDYLIRVGLVPRTAGQKPVQLVGQKERRTKGNDNPA